MTRGVSLTVNAGPNDTAPRPRSPGSTRQPHEAQPGGPTAYAISIPFVSSSTGPPKQKIMWGQMAWWAASASMQLYSNANIADLCFQPGHRGYWTLERNGRRPIWARLGRRQPKVAVTRLNVPHRYSTAVQSGHNARGN
jgi:hypothetical protein